MSAPHRAFSFDRGDDGRLPPADHRSVSPVYPPVEEHPDELAHGHPSPYAPTASVDDAPRLGPSQPNRSRAAATPGMDNLGPAAVGGGIGGIALGIANSHDRLSGIDARQSPGGMDNDGFTGPVERGYTTTGSDNPYVPPPPDFPGYASSESLMQAARDSYGSSMPLGAGAAPVGQAVSSPSTPRLDPSRRSLLDRQSYPYPVAASLNDGPFQRNSAYNGGTNAVAINPDEIVDDGDDGIPLSHGQKTPRAAAAGGAAGGGVLGAFGGLMKGNQATNPSYGPVPGGGGAGAGLEAGEKSRWVQPKPSGRNRRRGWICGAVLAFIVVGAIVGGAVGGIVGNRESDKEGRTGTAQDDKMTNGDLDKDSDEIKSLMNNQGLHKVFPGVDYTPWGVQYPLCLTYPPSQNNVTRDMAVLTQMTNNVRLYGTDCNQTEMVLHAIDRLELTNMKVWLGVWIDSNDTTNDRQLKQFYKILDDNEDTSIFHGAIIGNEALFRAGSNIQSAQKKLIGYMEDVRRELKKRNIDMPVATSDLGDNWNKGLVKASDLVMSNIHPFFAGVTAKQAASWTYSFWQNHNVPLTKGTNKKQVISEVGWPSGGGNNCGSNNKCTSPDAGSVAGVDEMNQFMSDWICQALENGTSYFWFEAFNEPWKVRFNTKDEAWEDKWGLMDAARKLKPGIKIPDCGGKTAS